MQNKNNIAGNREHRNTGTPEQPPQTPRARGARGGGNRVEDV
ncbi:hypothetical protein PLAN_40488 [Planktothrix rubescens CCAP 1459/22]|uniref:Uncharacterized protein n=1 Tax=Planktothrix rubescens CCAP 1459/22 TaxID=329571 RepID=A0A6J7ZMM6_PLARU|nr:hypothetical protein PLAN_40488 [Planktothrix rubescens NIVA-CYA 18]